MNMSNIRKQEGDIADAIFYVQEAILRLEDSNDKLLTYYTEALYNLHAAEKILTNRRRAKKISKSIKGGENEAPTSNSGND